MLTLCCYRDAEALRQKQKVSVHLHRNSQPAGLMGGLSAKGGAEDGVGRGREMTLLSAQLRVDDVLPS